MCASRGTQPKASRRSPLWAVLILILALGASLQATTIIINPGATLAGNAPALAAFNRAASDWAVMFSDPITVTIAADMADMGGGGIIGSSSSVMLVGGYNLIEGAMAADADADDGILGSLPAAAQFSAFMPVGFGLSGSIAATKANLKALGFAGLDGAFGVTDATITFNSQFAFDYDNSDGVTPGTIDFETVAAHELGHALGFVSVVDSIDVAIHNGQSGDFWVEPLDLFRFSGTAPATPGQFTSFPRDLRPGNSPYFADLGHQWNFSTGVYNGDGRQASHWKDDAFTAFFIGLMDPTLSYGTIEPITHADIRALDVIGWNFVEVPEPGTMVLLGAGLLALGLAGRVRRTRTPR